MKSLPEAFMREMHQLFVDSNRADEWLQFLDSFKKDPQTALRANGLKINPEMLVGLIAEAANVPVTAIKRVPWTDDALYCPEQFQPGRFTGYAAGLYYIQEPSAMLPAKILAAKPGERILDLCAAPGGKSARIAADLDNQGLLWANEISPKRARALQRNVDLTGSPKTLITCASPQKLSEHLTDYFDAIITDVPCSGSGMFRRDPQAIRSWLAHPPETYPDLQLAILKDAWRMLKPDGRLVYATCSFSLVENEQVITHFLAQHLDSELLEIEKRDGLQSGIPIASGLEKTARIWPHLAEGEGHFCALLHKQVRQGANIPDYQVESDDSDAWAAFDHFCHDVLSAAGQEKIRQLMQTGFSRFERTNLHIIPHCPDAIKKFSKIKTGLFLGRVHKAGSGLRFDPSVALLLYLDQHDFQRTLSDSADSDLLRRCLAGETLTVEPDQWRDCWQPGDRVVIMLQYRDKKFPLSWSRVMSPPLLKNDYPRGWVRF